MNAFVCHMQFEFLSGLRNRSLLFMLYLMPLGFYLLMGAVMTELNPFFQDLVIPSMVTFAVLTGSIMGLPSPLLEAREKGILRMYRVHGIPAGNVLIIPALSAGVHLFMVMSILIITAPLLFSAPLPVYWPGLFLVFFAFLLAATGLGTLLGVVAGDSRICLLLSQLIYIPSMLLGGLMVPTDMLPAVFKPVAGLLPTTYAMQGFRALAWQESILSSSPYIPVALLAVGGLLAFILSAVLFSWDQSNRSKKVSRLWALVAFLPYILGIVIL